MCYRLFYLIHLLLDSRHSITFQVARKRAAPLGERFLPFRGGEIHAALLGVHIAQVGTNGGIVRFAFSGLAQSGFCLVGLILLVITPAKTVEIRAVKGLLVQRALHEILGFVEADAALGTHVAGIM